jgi:hypothetical protein
MQRMLRAKCFPDTPAGISIQGGWVAGASSWSRNRDAVTSSSNTVLHGGTTAVKATNVVHASGIWYMTIQTQAAPPTPNNTDGASVIAVLVSGDNSAFSLNHVTISTGNAGNGGAAGGKGGTGGTGGVGGGGVGGPSFTVVTLNGAAVTVDSASVLTFGAGGTGGGNGVAANPQRTVVRCPGALTAAHWRTNDSCDAVTGCKTINNTVACSDGSACTADSCNATTGCTHWFVQDGTGCGGNNDCKSWRVGGAQVRRRRRPGRHWREL